MLLRRAKRILPPVVEGLRKEAGRRAESVQRERQQNEEERKRRERLEEIKRCPSFPDGDEVGAEMGRSYRSASLLPEYLYSCRRLLCFLKGMPASGGVMALDGKVVVEARYQKVEIEKDGTVHLTIIPGKVKTIKL